MARFTVKPNGTIQGVWPAGCDLGRREDYEKFQQFYPEETWPDKFVIVDIDGIDDATAKLWAAQDADDEEYDPETGEITKEAVFRAASTHTIDVNALERRSREADDAKDGNGRFRKTLLHYKKITRNFADADVKAAIVDRR